MKINFKKISITKSSFKKDKIKPLHDWAIIVGVFFVGLILVALIHSYLFKNLKQKMTDLDEFENTSSVLIDQKKIDRTYEFIEKRQEAFSNALNSNTKTTDPAI